MVILVDKEDKEIGHMEKLKAHEYGLLHRAFSVFIFNLQGDMLIQKRASSKYHSPGLWTNACCSHPKPGESNQEACRRRLQEEIGIQISEELNHHGHLLYKTKFDNGLTEHEYDHVFSFKTDSLPILNPEEASDFRYISMESLKKEIQENPENFTFWFKQILEGDYFS